MSMQPFTDAVQRALADRNYYAALAVSLTLPDVCGKIEKPTEDHKPRYIAWVTKYLMPRYPPPPGAGFGPFVAPKITAEDFYALRCAYLHEASDELSNQQIRQTLDAFRFTAPRPRQRAHMNYVVQMGTGHKTAQLQVDIFCNDVCDGVAAWSRDIAGDQAAQGRFATLLKIW
jgi:hypothetical protein